MADCRVNSNHPHLSLLPFLIHHSADQCHSRLKTYLFNKSFPAVSVLHPGLPSQTITRAVSSELLDFRFSLCFRFWCCALYLAVSSVSFWAHVNIPSGMVSQTRHTHISHTHWLHLKVMWISGCRYVTPHLHGRSPNLWVDRDVHLIKISCHLW